MNLEENKKIILLVEDEINLGETLYDYLESIDYKVFWSKSFKQALSIFHQTNPDIVLLDITLPDGNGLELGKKLISLNQSLKIIFLSALNTPEVKVQSFELGAYDYITKPFALKELTHRLKNLTILSQVKIQDDKKIQIGELQIDFQGYKIYDAYKKVINLSNKECHILRLLYQNKNQAITREHIINIVWGESEYPSNRTVDNYIVKLRKWCETDNSKKINIISIRSVGYMLEIQ